MQKALRLESWLRQPLFQPAPVTARIGRADGRTRLQVGAFEGIEVAGHYDVEVRTGSADVHAPARRRTSNAVVEVKGNRLLITPQERGPHVAP